MSVFYVNSRSIELPAVPITPRATTCDESAWQFGRYVTVKLLMPVQALRVHTDGKSFPGRSGSQSAGRWVVIGDDIQTAPEIASTRSLPTSNPNSMTAFTHVNEATLPAGCVINIGIVSPKFGGKGGGFQAEYVSGPAFTFRPLEGKRWHNHSARA